MRHLVERHQLVLPADALQPAGQWQRAVTPPAAWQLADQLVADVAAGIGVDHVERRPRPGGEAAPERLEVARGRQAKKPRIGIGRSQTADSERAAGAPSRNGEMIGPRRVTSTRSVTISPPRTSIGSSSTSHGTSSVPSRTEAPSSPSSSMNRSAWSVMPAVMPQAAWPLCAIGSTGSRRTRRRPPPMPGSAGGPGTTAPAAGRRDAGRWPAAARRWRSARRPMAQLLDPPGDGAAEAKAARSSASRS